MGGLLKDPRLDGPAWQMVGPVYYNASTIGYKKGLFCATTPAVYAAVLWCRNGGRMSTVISSLIEIFVYTYIYIIIYFFVYILYIFVLN